MFSLPHHSPRDLLVGDPRPFYTREGLGALAAGLRPGGVFGLWSNDPPDPEFSRDLAAVFAEVAAEVVRFANPLTGGQAANTVYLAVRR